MNQSDYPTFLLINNQCVWWIYEIPRGDAWNDRDLFTITLKATTALHGFLDYTPLLCLTRSASTQSSDCAPTEERRHVEGKVFRGEEQASDVGGLKAAQWSHDNKHQHGLHPTNQLKPQNGASVWAVSRMSAAVSVAKNINHTQWCGVNYNLRFDHKHRLVSEILLKKPITRLFTDQLQRRKHYSIVS